MNFKLWLIEQSSINLSNKIDNREFQFLNIIVNGEYAGKINVGVSVSSGRKIGNIYDVYLNDEFKGNNYLQILFPQIERDFINQGVEEIRLNTVDDPVGEKVWKPLGFNTSSTGQTKTWIKKIENVLRIPSKETALNLMTQIAFLPQINQETIKLAKDLSSMINYVPKNEQKRAKLLISKILN